MSNYQKYIITINQSSPVYGYKEKLQGADLLYKILSEALVGKTIHGISVRPFTEQSPTKDDFEFDKPPKELYGTPVELDPSKQMGSLEEIRDKAISRGYDAKGVATKDETAPASEPSAVEAEGVATETCPTCKGRKTVPSIWGAIECDDCRGTGQVSKGVA